MRRGAVTCEPAMPQNGATALARAAFCGHADTVELLVDRGADLEAKSRVSAAAVCCCATGRAGRQGGAKGAAMALMRRALVFLSRACVWGGAGGGGVRRSCRGPACKAALAGRMSVGERWCEWVRRHEGLRHRRVIIRRLLWLHLVVTRAR